MKSVGNSIITYLRFDNLDGPSYSIQKNEVVKIVYQNGIVDNFDKHGTKAKIKKRFGDNILTFIPASYLVSIIDETIKDPGIGFCYERLLDENGHISFVLPVSINFSQTSDFNNNYYGYNNYTTDKSYNSWMLMPGVKFYPAKATQKVRYAFGVSLFTLLGAEPYWAYDNSASNTSGDWHYTMYGIMISNSINVSITNHFYMEMDFNGGFPFSDNRYKDRSSLESLVSPLMQFALKAGCRF